MLTLDKGCIHQKFWVMKRKLREILPNKSVNKSIFLKIENENNFFLIKEIPKIIFVKTISDKKINSKILFSDNMNNEI